MSHELKMVLLKEFPEYVVFNNGDVFDCKRNRLLKASVNPAGYYNYRLKARNGRRITVGRHRLLAMAFIEMPSYDLNLVVNHKNGIKGDDRVENLEWVTQSENIRHAGRLGINPKCLLVSTRNVQTGEVREFDSYVDCANFYGISKDSVSLRVKKGPCSISPEGLQFRLGKKDDDWPLILDVELNMSNFGKAVRFEVLDTYDNTVLKFESATNLAAFLDCSVASISTRVRKEKQPLFKNRFLLKRLDNKDPWREVSDSLSEDAALYGFKPIKVVDSKTNHTQVFKNCREAAKVLNLLPSTLSYRLNNSQGKPFKDGLIFTFL